MAIVHKTEIDGQYPVILHNNLRNGFVVEYGAEKKEYLTYEEAAKEYGECIFHALCCAGLLD